MIKTRHLFLVVSLLLMMSACDTQQAAAVWVAFLAVMLVQVISEERRLSRDFGKEYDAYCRRTRRF